MTKSTMSMDQVNTTAALVGEAVPRATQGSRRPSVTSRASVTRIHLRTEDLGRLVAK